MGSFAGVSIDAQNLQEVVNLAEQKKILAEQTKLYQLSQSLTDYRKNLLNSTFPDGQYYVTSDFKSQLIQFQGDAYNPNQPFTGMPPVLRQFKKGELINVVTTPTNMAGDVVKGISVSNVGAFYADQTKLSKTKPFETENSESLTETKKVNGDKTKIIIIGAFILGYLLRNK